ncbi:hypothetical protein HGRIS_005297 [Hohenbuehelia grisea]|uniref:Laccase n=1 Tax=Hohenbuehelia grisea TaxID=104357 RepID=A0ABR3JES6_9AGAR
MSVKGLLKSAMRHFLKRPPDRTWRSVDVCPRRLHCANIQGILNGPPVSTFPRLHQPEICETNDTELLDVGTRLQVNLFSSPRQSFPPMVFSSHLVAYAAIALSLSSGSYGIIGPTASLYLNNGVVSPDGFNRPAVLASATSTGTPAIGPLIGGVHILGLPETFRLNVRNQLTDTSMLKSSSIHWHGFFQEGTSWADGPAFITQCPIAAGNSFLYEFKVTKQPGTYWYHSHLSTQYCDGLRGPMVVYEYPDPLKLAGLYTIDNEDTVITLADWYHAIAPIGPLAGIPTPDATLINGKGRYAGGPTVALAVVHVIKGLKYRFRLVSLSCDPNWKFSIDGHSLTIIEVDGIRHQSHTVDEIQIFAGQRYSFVLNANKDIKNYWIRANPNVGTIDFAGGINSAILRYIGAPNADPTTASSVSNPLLETSLVPFTNPGAPGGSAPADVAINLAIAFTFPAFEFQINGATFHPPTAPVLLQILSGATPPGSLLPAGSVYSLPSNKVIELSIPGGSAGSPHPIHLHGVSPAARLSFTDSDSGLACL